MSTLAKRILGEADRDDDLRRLVHKSGFLPPYSKYKMVLAALGARTDDLPEYIRGASLFLAFEGLKKVPDEDGRHWWIWHIFSWPTPDPDNVYSGSFALLTFYRTNKHPNDVVQHTRMYTRDSYLVYNDMPPDDIRVILESQIKEFIGRLRKVLDVWRIPQPNMELGSAIKLSRDK